MELLDPPPILNLADFIPFHLRESGVMLRGASLLFGPTILVNCINPSVPHTYAKESLGTKIGPVTLLKTVRWLEAPEASIQYSSPKEPFLEGVEPLASTSWCSLYLFHRRFLPAARQRVGCFLSPAIFPSADCRSIRRPSSRAKYGHVKYPFIYVFAG